MCVDVFAQAGQIVQRECRDVSKTTAVYLSAIIGAKSVRKVTKEEVLAGRNVPATNCISESTHASSTVDFQYTTRPDHICATGQTRSNKDYHRAHNN